ncbi:MAG: hypothetical protein FWC50_00555 [Planctomycetaceae bacterium]|nr:hypothetical protein [Planctomycetaceae bacterium]
MKSKPFASLCLCVLVVLCAAGCGDKGKGLKTEYVEGVVTLDGKPLEKASVQFSPLKFDLSATPAPGQPEMANGLTDSAGKYTLSSINGDVGKGAIAGEYRVLVTKIKATTVETDAAGRPVGAAKLDSAGHPILTTQEDLIPAVYKDRKKSPLTFTVVPGKNLNVNFDLTSDAK